MNQLLDPIMKALSVPSAPAYGAALVWGLASVFLSPCHLASIPLVIGYVNSGRKPAVGRAFLLSSLFAVGILVTLGALGGIAALMGTLAGNVGIAPQLIVSLLLVASGLWLMDVPPFTRFSVSPTRSGMARRRMGAFMLGLAYGVILGPCSFAFLAPMVGIAFSAGAGSWMFGASLMAVYALGHCGAIVAAGTLGDRLRFLLENGGLAAVAVWLKRACGLLVAAAGIIQGLRAFGVEI